MNQWALLAKLEAAYLGGGAAAPGTDAILTTEPPVVDMDYIHQGERNGRWSGGAAKRVAKSGRFGTIPAQTEATGAGAAYSASAFPNVHALLRAMGYAATLDTTLGAEKYAYAPNGSGGSLSVEAYVAGEKRALTGVYANQLVVSADGPVVPLWAFDLQGVMPALPSDAGVPAGVAYPDVDPAKATNITLKIGAVADLVVSSFTFTKERSLTARADENSAGHKGFTPGNHTARLELTVEATATSAFNPYDLADLATTQAVELTIGSVKYNKYTLKALNAQVADVEDAADDATAKWNLVLEFKPSAPGLTDTHTWTFD